MRTWVILSLVCLMCVVAVSGAAKKRSHAAGLIRGLQRASRKTTGKVQGARAQGIERIARRKFAEIRNPATKREHQLDRIVRLLEAKLTKRDGPGPAKQSSEDWDGPAPKSSQDWEGPEGLEELPPNPADEVTAYFSLLMLSSPGFCATPLRNDVVNGMRESLLERAGNAKTSLQALIDRINNLDNAAPTRRRRQTVDEDDPVAELADSFSEALGDVLEEMELESMNITAEFFRAVVYGTEQEGYCRVGEDTYVSDWETEPPEEKLVENHWDRLLCVGTNIEVFRVILSIFWDYIDQEYENEACSATRDYVRGLRGEAPNADDMATAVKADAECVIDKIENATNSEWIANIEDALEEDSSLVENKINDLQDRLYSILEDLWGLLEALHRLDPENYVNGGPDSNEQPQPPPPQPSEKKADKKAKKSNDNDNNEVARLLLRLLKSNKRK